MHERLLTGVRGQDKTPGKFRTSQNWIESPDNRPDTARFVPPPVEQMSNALSDWERYIHDRHPRLPLLIPCALLHYQFETIHPFLDGNRGSVLGRFGGRWIGGIRLTGAAIHWLVTGTLELASTAIPAVVAFGVALARMAPAAVFVKDQMTNLVNASGGLHGPLLNSVGPLHRLGLGFRQLSKAMAPTCT